MKGVFNLRTPAPRYNFIWDASVVLNFLRKLPDDNDLPLKLLTSKLVMLIALVSGQRVQTLSCLNLRFSYRVYDSLIFIIPDLTKTFGPGKIAVQVVLSQCDQDKKICVVRCLTKYLSRTLKHCSSSKLFLSLQKPFRPVGSQTLSCWIKTLLHMSGIRTFLELTARNSAGFSLVGALLGDPDELFAPPHKIKFIKLKNCPPPSSLLIMTTIFLDIFSVFA